MTKYRNRTWLVQKYCDEELSSLEIAKICNCGNRTIFRWLEKFGIETRTISEACKGRVPWNKGKKWPEKVKDKFRKAHVGKILTEEHKENIGKALLGKTFTEEHKRKMSENHADMSGSKSPMWKGGLSFLPYPPEFNKKLKRRIRERDGNACQFCGTKENGRELPIHHIDYNKENNDDFNLIALCDFCNIDANVDREKWQFFFEVYQEMRSGVCAL